MTKKISNCMRYFALSLVLMTSLILAPILEANAEGGATDVTAYVSGDDISGASTTYAEGISPTKSGYMVYLVDEHGNAVKYRKNNLSDTLVLCQRK